ncbi:MAG TPA: glycoside hydrolase family 3 N-terminal domain-containing protein [Candidatus Paceibacterota bacterium]
MKLFARLILILIVVLAALSFFNTYITPFPEEKLPLPPLPPVLSVEEIARNAVREEIASISLRKKVGQLLIAGLEGQVIDTHTKKLIEEYGVGGFNLLKRNVKNREQITSLIRDLQASSSIPLFIAVDQEGGSTIRFSFLKELQSELSIKSTSTAFTIAKARGQELAALGVNMNFSPVLDSVSDKKSYLYPRTFGTTTDAIGHLGAAMVEGYEEGGVVPVPKHFPGYGNIVNDPHKKEVSLSVSERDFEEGLLPFARVIGSVDVPAIMTAHIVIDSIDSAPATLSPRILNILRNRYGFDGVIITDDLEMASTGLPPAKAAVLSIKAGADMVISTHTPKIHLEVLNALEAAVVSGELPISRIDESLERISLLKKKYLR